MADPSDNRRVMSLGYYLRVLKKYFILIIATTVVGLVAAVLYCFVIAVPLYTASGQLVVVQPTTAAGNAQVNPNIQSDLQLTNTYIQVLESPTIIQKVIDELHLSESVAEVRGQLRATSATNSLVITVTATTPSPQLSAQLANTTAQVFQQNVGSVLNVSNVGILSTAQAPTSPSSPQKTRYIPAGFVGGLILGIAAAFVVELVRDKIEDKDELNDLLGKPVVGLIPNFDEKKSKKQGKRAINSIEALEQENSRANKMLNESIEIIRANINFMRVDNKAIQSILITSAGEHEGKSTVATHLAANIAEQGKKTLYFDGDFRRRGGSRKLGSYQTLGKSENLFELLDEDGATDFLSTVYAIDGSPNLFAINTRGGASRASMALGSDVLKEAFDQWRNEFDAIVIDSPPVLGMADTIMLSTFADITIVVTRKGITKRRDILEVKKQFETLHAPIEGSILNDIAREKSNYYYYYNSYE